MYKCKICGKELKQLQGLSHHIKSIHNMEQKDYYDKYLKDINEGLCKICNKPTNFYNFSKGYYTYCSQSCIHKDDEIQQKYNATMQERYGFTHFFKDKKTQIKIRNSVGYKNRKSSFSNEKTIKKIKEVRKNKLYEFEQNNDCTQMKKIVDKYNSTAWKKLKLPVLKLGEDAFIENKYLKDIDAFMSNWEDNKKNKSYSKTEKYILNQIKAYYKGKIIQNSRRIIKPYELDIYLPELNIAIEFNGLYYHSSESNTPIDYHKTKSILCKENNIRLIHIYEFEDLNKQIKLLKDLILYNKDNYPDRDYNKNNLQGNVKRIKPYKYTINDLDIYTVGKLL